MESSGGSPRSAHRNPRDAGVPNRKRKKRTALYVVAGLLLVGLALLYAFKDEISLRLINWKPTANGIILAGNAVIPHKEIVVPPNMLEFQRYDPVTP